MKQTDHIVTIPNDGYHYTSGYYTDNRWLDNDTLILMRSKSPDKDYNEMVKYSLKDGSIELLCDDAYGYSNHVVWNDLIYYSDSKKITVLDTKTNEKKVVYERLPDDPERLQMPSITKDGKAICVYGEMPEQPGVFAVIDIETGKRMYKFEKGFAPPFVVANHGMICPTNPNRIFFAHEGITFYVSNRLWIYDAQLDKAWTIAKQNLDEDGNLADCYGHEMWSPDGKGMFFTKYPCSPKGPRGVSYVDIETNQSEVLYSKYNYWHTGVSQDGKYITADTTGDGMGHSDVVVIDRADNTESVIDSPSITGVHPCHPHPQLSPDNSKVVYTALDETGRTCVKIAYLK